MATHDPELEELRAVEQMLRDFLTYYAAQVAASTEHRRPFPFAARTVFLVETAQPALDRLDQLRAEESRAA